MAFPKAKDKKLQKLSNLLTAYTNNQFANVDFYIADEQISPEEMFNHIGGLTLFAVEAKNLYEKIYNRNYLYSDLTEHFKSTYSLTEQQKELDFKLFSEHPKQYHFPIQFIENKEKSLLGVVPILDENFNFSIISHFMVYTVEEFFLKNKIKKINSLNQERDSVDIAILYEQLIHKISTKQISITSNQKHSF